MAEQITVNQLPRIAAPRGRLAVLLSRIAKRSRVSLQEMRSMDRALTAAAARHVERTERS
jgi:hypothetical protein